MNSSIAASIPLIPEKGSLGASGDLAPLAHFACVLIGEGEAEYEGEIVRRSRCSQKAGLAPVTLAAKEGLALTNGTTVMTAVGLLETGKGDQACRTRRCRRLSEP